MLQFVLPFLIALLISIFLTPIVRVFAIRFRWVVQPNRERWHKRDTPVLGGAAIFLSFVISYAIFAQAHDWTFWAFVKSAKNRSGIFTLMRHSAEY